MRNSVDIAITEIRGVTQMFARILPRDVIYLPPPLSRNEIVFKPGTYHLFIQIFNTHAKLFSPPPSLPTFRPPVLSLCQLCATHQRSSPTNISRCECEGEGWPGGWMQYPRIARRLCAKSTYNRTCSRSERAV